MPYSVADLFCGAGGTSAGALDALSALKMKASLTAVNHWDIAISTHSTNHPGARHFCASLDSLNPRDIFRENTLDLLWASPECTHHSVARGGRPIKDQSRSTAWCVVRWAEALRPKTILVENVPEFRGWGPLDSKGRPLKKRKGEIFQSWIQNLKAIGYRVDYRILKSADYGDPTTRQRLFIQAVRGRRKIVWPNPTHAEDVTPGLFETLRPWRTARNSVIDWSLSGTSIHNRKRPLAPKTIERIEAGLRDFGFNGYLICMENGGSVRSLDRPIPTVTCAKGGSMAVVEPYLIEFRGTKKKQLERSARSIDKPLPIITCGGTHLGLIEPFLLPQQSGGKHRLVSKPLPTVSTAGAISIVEPYLVRYNGTSGAESIDRPISTLDCKARHGLVMPEVIYDGEKYLLDIRFRMLKPHELAAGMGFPKDYKFTGNVTQQVKQIGNAVTHNLSRALVAATVSQNSDVSWLWS